MTTRILASTLATFINVASDIKPIDYIVVDRVKIVYLVENVGPE